ncbi:histone H1-like [Astatotilapia calliptera]|uniref:histone H1-like n=1 Tax=Astatotilapia calliptera TaxID=8154 RepID=UPI000E40DE2A|nr:histone H1-like [Astatotilapia calliptera]
MMRSTCQRCGGKGSIINTPCAEVQAKKKKTMTSKPKKVGLSVGELIVKAVAALKKALAAGGYDVDKNKARVKTAIKSLVAKGTLVQTKGTGASGSFKMNRVTETKAKTPAAAKAKKPAAAAKKSPRKAAAAALQPLARSQPHQRTIVRDKAEGELPAVGLLKWERTTE